MQDQHNETKNYFENVSEEWFHEANTASLDEVNVIQQRNKFVLDYCLAQNNVRTFLDIGCGTGELVREAAAQGIASLGIDFSENMIQKALSATHGSNNASFRVENFFECALESDCYDVVSACGFIEYISREDLHTLFKRINTALHSKGAFIVGSRNRLFNIFSSNLFTTLELECSQASAASLLNEAVVLCSSPNIPHFNSLATKLTFIEEQQFNHPFTGIEVSKRYQYTPAELASLGRRFGFTCRSVKPIHFHCFPPNLKQTFHKLFSFVANKVEECGQDNLSLLPQSSSFMMRFEKNG